MKKTNLKIDTAYSIITSFKMLIPVSLATSCHSLLLPDTLLHLGTLPHYVTSRSATLYCVTLHHLQSRYVAVCHTLSLSVVSCQSLPHRATLSHIVILARCVTFSHFATVSRRVILCVTPCHIVALSDTESV